MNDINKKEGANKLTRPRRESSGYKARLVVTTN